MWIVHCKEIWKLAFRAWALRQRIEELWVLCGLNTERWSYTIGWCMAKEEQQNKLGKWKAFVRVDTVRIKGADFKLFFPIVLWLPVLPWRRERSQTAMSCLEWLVRLKYLATWRIFIVFLYVKKALRNLSPSPLPFSPIYNFLQRGQFVK